MKLKKLIVACKRISSQKLIISNVPFVMEKERSCVEHSIRRFGINMLCHCMRFALIMNNRDFISLMLKHCNSMQNI